MCLLLAGSPVVNAAVVSLDLTCVLNGLGGPGSCAAGPSFGTVELEDLAGADVGKVKVTVDLGMAGDQKFRDLMLNFAGTATTITDSDAGNTVSLSSNAFSITPYSGDFDIGGSGGQGWSATTTGPYSTVLAGNVAISTTDFLTLDTGGNLYAALHIQAIGNANGGTCDGESTPPCAPGVNGDGSLKIGAPVVLPGGDIPEPTSLCLFGAATAALAMVRRRN
jgi:hypothetical protein